MRTSVKSASHVQVLETWSGTRSWPDADDTCQRWNDWQRWVDFSRL